MKKTALFCALCLFIALIPFSVSANSTAEVVVSDVANDIVTVKGTAPVDTIISILILNPGKTVADVSTQHIEAVQYMGQIYSLGGEFTHNIKMDTGAMPNKTEGTFSVFVTVDNNLVYSNRNFAFYSNETKSSYVNDLKNCTETELLAAENASYTKIEKIFETFSLSNHELFKEATPHQLAKVIAAQKERKNLSIPTDVDLFLNKILVFNAFCQGSDTLKEGDGLKYPEIWAKDGNTVSTLYTVNFAQDLNGNGKKAVVNALLNANYDGKEYTYTLDVLKDAILLNVIINNNSYGAGHIDDFILDKFNADYKAKGFNTAALAAITDPQKRAEKLEKILLCGATDINTLKTNFNLIVTANDEENNGNNQDDNSSSSVSAPSGGGGGGGFKPIETPAPTEPSQPTPEKPKAGYTFTDMSSTHWANDAVEYLYSKGIVNGRDEQTFAPGDTVTRAELVKMIVEAFEISQNADDKTFSDVNDSDWFASYIKKAASAGIVTGDGGTFRPNSGVTREDAAVIIFRALGLDVGGKADFTDADSISDYAKEAIFAMNAGGYINGMGDGTFAPKNTLTRAQAAQLIYNALMKGDAK